MTVLLDDALDAGDDAEFNEALRRHGAVHASELDVLQLATTSWRNNRRLNATRLMALVRETPERVEALARVARTTGDVGVWGIALNALFTDAPSVAHEIAVQRADLRRRALEQKGVVFQAGLRAAVAAGDPGIDDMVSASLNDNDPTVRRAAVEAIDETTLGRFLPNLRRRLQAEPESDIASGIARLLVVSDDADVHRELMDWYWAGDIYRQSRLTNVFVQNPRPWVRQYWMNALDEGPDHRRRALDVLGDTAGEELLPVCLSVYDAIPPRGQPGFVEASVERGPCDRLVSRLAGRELRGDDAEGWVRARLRR